MARFTVYIRTDVVGSQCSQTLEVPDDELEGLTEQERDEFIEEDAREIAMNMCEWGWIEQKGESDA